MGHCAGGESLRVAGQSRGMDGPAAGGGRSRDFSGSNLAHGYLEPKPLK